MAEWSILQTLALLTRSTQRARTSAERQHNRIAEWFLYCKLALQLWSESTRYFFDNPVNPDFRLRTPGSGRWSGSSPKFTPLVPVPGPCPNPPRNLVKICSQLFSYPTDRRTDWSKNNTSFFGGGKNMEHSRLADEHIPCTRVHANNFCDNNDRILETDLLCHQFIHVFYTRIRLVSSSE